MEMLQSLKQTADRWLYPELAQIAPQHRVRAMERARSERFDFLEMASILAAVIVVTYLTRYGMSDPSGPDRLAAAVANFVVAIPQLLLLAGPFFVRRNRRGLRAFLADQGRR